MPVVPVGPVPQPIRKPARFMSAPIACRSLVTVRKPETWQGTYDFIGMSQYLPGPRGLPLLKPPFGSIVAIDMNTGDHRWRIPIGRSDAIYALTGLGGGENWDCLRAVGRW